jgi:ABC-type hemin transport system ATPase subunit
VLRCLLWYEAARDISWQGSVLAIRTGAIPTRMEIKGYKSSVDVRVELQPLVVLLGPNAAGKSNLLDA